ncbi:hypothetical protein OSCI_3420022 [Kamptonema sp. PCC 6506]|nr:hypothetical protein OSCI_3420022 [Kamptonema sp. PCC 6506]
MFAIELTVLTNYYQIYATSTRKKLDSSTLGKLETLWTWRTIPE